MGIFKGIGACAAVIGLAGCGGGGGGTVSSSGALNYIPVFASGPSDTVTASLVASGATGTLSQSNGLSNRASLTSIKVRLSPDRQTAYVSVGGGAERALTADPTVAAPTATGGLYGSSTNTSIPSLGLTNLTETSIVSYTVGSDGGFGYIGIETPPGGLPASASYTGNWTAFINPIPSAITDFASGGGTLTLNVAFGSNTANGTFSGSFSDGAPSGQPASGLITATTIENGLLGQFDFNSGKYQGDVDFAAKAYGDAADVVAGSLAGSIVNGTTANTQAIYGTFSAD